MRYTISLLLPALLAPAFAQQAPLALPILGFLPAGASLRPLTGIPGSVRRGDPVPLPDSLDAVLLAPGHEYALAIPSAGDTPLLLRPSTGLAPLALDDLAGCTRAFFSPTGRAFACISPAGIASLVSGMPLQPRITRRLVIDPDATLALSDDAATVLWITPTSLSLLAGDSWTPLYDSTSLGPIQFVPLSSDILLLDPARNQLVRIQDPAGRFTSTVLAIPDDLNPRFLAASTDGRWLLAAGDQLWLTDSTTNLSQVFSLPEPATSLDLVSLRDTYLLSHAVDHPAWLLSLNGGQPLVTVIPGGLQ